MLLKQKKLPSISVAHKLLWVGHTLALVSFSWKNSKFLLISERW